MGLLDSILGSLLGSSQTGPSGAGPAGTGASGIGSVLSGLLGGQGSGAASSGLGDVLSKFEQAGLGSLAQSWVGNGPNHSVTPQQLQNVFGDDVPQMANQAGMDQGDFLSELSQHLPNVINQMTPNGQAQNNGAVDV